MGWYGIFLVKKINLAFSLRSMSRDNLYSAFDSLDRFFEKYDKIKEDIEYIQEISEQEKTFSAKTTAKMFSIIDGISHLPEHSDAVLLLYSLNKLGLNIDYLSEGEIDLDNLKKKGWNIISYG